MIAPLLALALAAEPATPAGMEVVGFAEAVRRAMARNPGALVAVDEVQRAEGLLGEARSFSLPNLVGVGTGTALDSPRLLGSGPTAKVIIPQDQIGGTVTAALPVVSVSSWYRWAHGSQTLEATAAGEKDAKRTVAIAAGRAYLTVLATRRVVDVSESARDTAQAHWEFARRRRGGGLGNALDELRAEQETHASQVQVEAAYTSLARAREALGVLAGDDRPLDAAEEPLLGELPLPGEATREAEASRDDIKAARARLYAAERVSKDSWADWMPTLLATWQGIYAQPPTLTTPHLGWQAQLVLTVPIFEGGLRRAQVEERDALAREALDQLEGVVRQARSEVRVAFEALKRARAGLDAARRGAVSARGALDLANQAYRVGTVNNLEVIDAERQARDAAISAVIAEDAERQALLDLLAAAGRFP